MLGVGYMCARICAIIGSFTLASDYMGFPSVLKSNWLLNNTPIVNHWQYHTDVFVFFVTDARKAQSAGQAFLLNGVKLRKTI